MFETKKKKGQDPSAVIYKNAIDCMVKIFKQEGISKGFFKGLLPPLINLSIINSFTFASYAMAKRILTERQNVTQQYQSALINFEAGAIVGSLSSFIATPFDLIKIRTQINRSSGKQAIGSIQMTKKLFGDHGFFVFYKGFVVNTVRELMFGAIYFGIYELLKQYLFHKIRS